MKTHLVIPDPHAHPKHNNDRALWVSGLIADVKPDVVIDLGDTADMPSLSGYDKGKRSYAGRTYAADVAAHNDFQDKLWWRPKKSKRKMPRRVRLIGNHEQRIDRALDMQPELQGAIGYQDLELERYYDDIVYYNGSTPGVIEIDGIHYAHYFVSGVMGRPIGGEHPAHSLISKKHNSCTQGHTHLFDHCLRVREDGQQIHGLIAGVCQDYASDWAGEVNRLWWRGVIIKRDVEDGSYNLEFISLDTLKREYGQA